MKKSYHYPRLSNKDFGLFRLSGPGLANCMFYAAEAYVASVKSHGIFIEPTWFKFSIGPWLRHERDKRVYNRIFKTYGVHGLKKIILILLWKIKLIRCESYCDISQYFTNLNQEYALVSEYFKLISKTEIIRSVENEDLSRTVAVHVRLGDYSQAMRTPLEWYHTIIRNISQLFPSLNFLIFSDGSDEELKSLTNIPKVNRAFFGNAYADMYAISKCCLLIASDSTFSGWGAFLGRVPLIFNKRHFPSVHGGNAPEFVIGNETTIPQEIIEELEKYTQNHLEKVNYPS